jgi:hypothetical protein
MKRRKLFFDTNTDYRLTIRIVFNTLISREDKHLSSSSLSIDIDNNDDVIFVDEYPRRKQDIKLLLYSHISSNHLKLEHLNMSRLIQLVASYKIERKEREREREKTKLYIRRTYIP